MEQRSPFGLRFHEKNKGGQNIGERRVGRDHFQNAALIEKEELLLLDLRDVAANDHATGHLAVGSSQRPAIDPRPNSIGRFLVPDENLDIIYLLAADRPRQRQLIRWKGRDPVRQVKPVTLRPFARGNLGRALARTSARPPG